jgi:tetratricopeptide (TPR) repeat protein
LRSSNFGRNVKTVLAEATDETNKALNLDERDPWAYLTRGAVFFRGCRHGEAERAYRRALEFNPNFALAHALLSEPLAAQGANNEAVACAEHAVRLSPSDRLLGGTASFAMAGAHFAAGRYADAVTWARNSIERYPEYQGYHTLLITAAAMQGDMQAAAEALSVRLGLRPDFSLTSVRENLPFTGEIRDRFLEGLVKAGVPQE